MEDLVAWLRSQLGEDERRAREVHARTCGHDAVDTDAACDCDWHVSRVLREVESKRRIIAAFEQREEESVSHPRGDVFHYHATGLRIAIKHLAMAYADCPGYREEWKP